MVRCKEWWEKFEKDGNFCGLSKPMLSNISFHKGIVDEVCKRGGDPEFTFVNFPEGASRPLHKIKDDESLLGKVLDNIAGRLKVGGSITANDVKDWIELASQPEEDRGDALLRSGAPAGARPTEVSIKDLQDFPGPTRLSDTLKTTPPAGWHPSTNGCYGCVVLGYTRDEGKKTPYHICCEAGRPPYGMEKCPLGTGPIKKVDCDLWGEDTLCHATADEKCDQARKKAAHCPIVYPEAMELIRRQVGRNPQNGRLTTEYCKLRDCKDLKKREMNNTLECSIAEKVPGNMIDCPKVDPEKKPAPIPEEVDEEDEVVCAWWNTALKTCDNDEPECTSEQRKERNCPLTPPPRTPAAPKEQKITEFLARQLHKCKEKKCPELVETPDEISCRVMVARDWHRFDCPLRPLIPPPKEKGTGKKSVSRLPSPHPTQAEKFTVEAGRHEMATIRNMIKYGDAEDEQDAVQTMFEDGAARWLDQMERRIQAEIKKGEEE